MDTEKDRIEKIMLDIGLNSSQFANEIGIKSPTLSHILNGRNNPSLDVLKRILERYKNINSDWLILGLGSMYRDKSSSQALNLFPDNGLTYGESVDYVPKQPTVKETENNLSQKKNADSLAKTVEPLQKTAEIEKKLIKKIIVYYDDNTFEEFHSN